MKTVAFCYLLFLVGCVQAPVTPTPSPSPSPSPLPIEKVWPINGFFPEYEDVITAYTPDFSKNHYGMARVCKSWASKSATDKSRIWLNLWKGIMKCETDFNRASWMPEALGIDPVTGHNVVSQGLLQLSYQDVRNYKTPECNEISWEKDKNALVQAVWKSKAYWVVTTPDATIHHPIKNLKCGMSIARALLAKYPNGHTDPAKGLGLGAYWSCARVGARGITEFLKYEPGCK